MKTTTWMVMGLLVCVAGCTSVAPQWEARFGDAARQARAAQVIDPAAPTRHGDRSAATDGKAVAGSQKAYADSYGYAVKETRQPVTATGAPGATGR
jgi:hypothetical protein